jgi:hypothetical protein
MEVGMEGFHVVLNMRNEHSRLYPPEHWLKRARETREIARALKDPEARREMERIALLYEKMAEFVGRQLQATQA